LKQFETLCHAAPRGPEGRLAASLCRVFAAVYHRGPTLNSGHYWALVRGRGGTCALLDDATVTTGEATPAVQRYHTDASARRVVLVGLERVDPSAAASASERHAVFAPTGGGAIFAPTGGGAAAAAPPPAARL